MKDSGIDKRKAEELALIAWLEFESYYEAYRCYQIFGSDFFKFKLLISNYKKLFKRRDLYGMPSLLSRSMFINYI